MRLGRSQSLSGDFVNGRKTIATYRKYVADNVLGARDSGRQTVRKAAMTAAAYNDVQMAYYEARGNEKFKLKRNLKNYGAATTAIQQFLTNYGADGQRYEPQVLAYLGRLHVDSGALNTAGGTPFAGITDTTTVNFTTAEAGIPTLVSTTPTDSATSVPVDSAVVLTFSEPVVAGTGDITIHNLSDGSTAETIPAASWQVAGSGTTQITINPGVDLVAGASPAPAAPAREPLRTLEVRGLTAVHDDGTVGAHGIDLRVERGELVLLLGQVGSGKSSLLS
ncbi:MAG TPA: hypothetical protein EYP98_15780, partial [Planctomycetes bacterium]|nr:hypothetical protein [Planctomycetota bacterium]